MKRALVLLVLAAAVASLVPGNAAALTRKQANAVALRVLHPQAGKKAVILFGLPARLPAGTFVVPADPRSKAKRAKRLSHPAWLYWLDQVPYAKFSHPSRYLLVDDRNGRVVANARTGWYPTVNGRRPAFLATKTSYGSKRFRVFARLPHRKRASFVSLSTPFGLTDPLAHPAAMVPPHALDGECVLIVSDFTDPRFINDFDAFSDWARSMKIPTFFATAKGPTTTIPGPEDGAATTDTLRDNTTQLIGKNNCKDILVYMSGHGIPASEGAAGVVTHATVHVSDEGETTREATTISPDEIHSMLSAHPSTGFKLKIDSCFAGRFRDALTETDADGSRKPILPNLLILENSSSATQVSSFANDAVDGNDNPNHVSEFTNQNLTGLTRFFESQQLMDDAVKDGGSFMAHALDHAYDLGADVNHAQDEAGDKIDPQKITSFGPPAPQIKPIHAVFTPSTFTTVYTEDATAPAGELLKYAWSVAFPADPKCGAAFKPNSPSQRQATWAHPDLSQGGPCGHAPAQVGPRGHKGTVTVVVTDTAGNWTCTATYFGTEGDGGKPTGDGDPPGPCKRT